MKDKTVSVFSFTYSVAFIVICMVTVCVSTCTYLFSHRRVYLAIASFFFFSMLEGLLTLLDEYQRQQLLSQIMAGQLPMLHEQAKFVFSLGIMASVWVFSLEIVNRYDRFNAIVPNVIFASFELLSLTIQPEWLKQLSFYTLRSFYLLMAFAMLAFEYKSMKPAAKQGFSFRYGTFLTSAAALTLLALVEDVCVLGFRTVAKGNPEFQLFFFERNLLENGLTLLAAFFAVRSAAQVLSRRFSIAAHVSENAALRVAESRMSSFCDMRGISERERDVLERLLEGADNRSIAESLFISVGTVKSHAHAIYKKCGVSSRSELIQSFWAD